MSRVLERLAVLALLAALSAVPHTARADGPDEDTGGTQPTTSQSRPAASAAQGDSFPLAEAARPGVDVDAGTITIPRTHGVRYETRAGKVLTAGTHMTSDRSLSVDAFPEPGYSLVGERSWTVSMDRDATDPRVPRRVAPLPTLDLDSRTVTVPETDTVRYHESGGPALAAGPHQIPADSSLTGIWMDDAAHTLVGITGASYWLTPHRGYRIIEPTFDVHGGRFTIPSDPRVQYTLNRGAIAPGTYMGGYRVVIGFTVKDPLASYSSPVKEWRVDYPDIWPVVDINPRVPHYAHMRWIIDTRISSPWVMPGQVREYRPQQSTQRDAMAAFLHRMAGHPHVTLPARSPFTDVRPTHPHYREIVWAYQQGITKGWVMKDGTRQFRPQLPIARDQMAAFLYRYAGEPATSSPTRPCFTDVSPRRTFAKEMCWMRSEGISTGWPDGSYRPAEPVKRDAMAAFLHRYAESI